ncbi:hypothetical protein [Gordonia malaquae]|uniref:hypothetical protein n=1 Tax=Gordonia malaquae TaxID=410332 RepID=UPI00301ADBAC
MSSTTKTFRVYNGTLRVGAQFPIGPMLLEWPTVAALGGWLLAAVALVGLSLMIGGVVGVALALIIAVIGVVGEMVMLVWVRRLKFLSPEPARIRERTHVPLLKDTVADPWYTNFDAPDEPSQGFDVDMSETIYRNH